MQTEVLIPGSGRPFVESDSLDHTGPLVQTVARVLSPDECARMIDRIEELGPAAAPITTPRGPVMRPDVRNNDRVMFDDPELARELFARVEGAIAPRLCGMRAVGANERFRCYRYAPGQRFAPHFDGAFIRDDRQRSLLSLIVYLNEDFTGGVTTFHDWDVHVVPRLGTALIFQHRLAHEGCEVIAGTKYVLRSDVMYEA
ncbi:MAG TPA: 2OG-Fe(II) oxygenase [Kofleriaceae bacterium]|nr:2OG-Fe(II) oxygenase [Kofleriaceae bacterium]